MTIFNSWTPINNFSHCCGLSWSGKFDIPAADIYLDKLAHVQVVINCRYFVAQLCTREDGLAYISGVPPIDDVMSYDSLTTVSQCKGTT